MGGTSIPGETELQQYASEVLAKIPQRKSSPPERAAIAGIFPKEAEDDEDVEDSVDEELFFPPANHVLLATGVYEAKEAVFAERGRDGSH
ncbi:hypothetical protein C1H46_001224 [Malus baccata]|uniref:Uncharacterized protein n=1 Tax=Malus baccata TaxID=106549 RepID=A0A540NRF4_MALBA|nr:hypothetical protein C1H46_001224 [Malus baccata]